MEVDVAADRAAVFELLSDLRGYDDWLGESSAFRTVDVEGGAPVGAGTRYRDVFQQRVAEGEVTRFEPPARLAFRETLGGGDATITTTYRLDELPGGTRVQRHYRFRARGRARYDLWRLRGEIRAENRRILSRLRDHIEAAP